MTYGENGNQIRAELTTLLRQHRIQQRLGGKGLHTLPETTTPDQREVMGQQIQRYRDATLAWCLRAAGAANSQLSLPPRTQEQSRGPVEELRHRITRSLQASDSGLPSLTELSTPQEFPIVESWRQVAKAAALGEHDFAGLMDAGRMSTPQCLTVLMDAAEVIRALAVLDKRYDKIPGWTPIRERGRLNRAAQACALPAGYPDPDYSVDQKGWRPPSATIDGRPLPGIGGVLQAEHNMLVHLGKFPKALNLRRVVDGQRILSHEAARCAYNVAPELAERWLEREQTYQQLTRDTRNVGGIIGAGGYAVAEAAFAVNRLRQVHADEITSPESMRDLDKLFSRADARIAAIIEQGVAERLYFASVKVPRIVDTSEHMVNPVRERYLPVFSPAMRDLLMLVRHHLRPLMPPPPAPKGAHQSRNEFHDAIAHRPTQRSGPPR